MKKVLFTAFLFLPLTLYAQYPGGINTNLKLWLKANSGLSLNTGSTVAQWNELSGAGVTGDFATQGSNISMGTQNTPAYQPAGINFNPHVVFSQSGVNSISSNNAFVGTQLIDPYNNTVFQVINLHTINGTGVWFKWQYNNTNVNRLGNEVNNGGTNAGKLRFDFRGINNFSTTIINDKYFLAGCNTTQSQSVIRLNGANDNVMSYTTQAAFAPATGSPARITLGNEEYGDPYPTTVDIAEVILYNRALTAAERNKVESYLAVKYGFTLDQSAASANDYTSSNGTVIWNRSANLPFVNNITGIGRDNGDSLIQRQSRSINSTGLVTIYHGSYNGNTFPALNISNTNNFTADNTYLLFGDNGGTTALNRCYSGNPSFLRMNRAWKVQMTGTVSTVTLAVKTADMPLHTTHLLVSTDSAFTPANTTAYKLDTMGGYLSKPVILQNNTYFTYASDSLILHPSSNSPLCVGGTIKLSVSIPGGGGTFSWTGPNFSSNLQNPAISASAVFNSGVYTVNATSNGCPFTPGTVVVSVSPMPAPPTVTTPLIYCQNDLALPLGGNGQNLAWYLVPSGGNGMTTPPVPYTGREDTLTWWVTQANNGCESIRTRQDVIIRGRPNGIIVGTQHVICQGDVDSFYYYGNARPYHQYDWKVPRASTTVIGGSGQGPYIVRFDSAGIITVRLQVNNNGCVSNEMLYAVTVNPRPMAHAVIKHDACPGEIVNISLNQLSKGITSYTWDFDDGDTHYAAPPGGPYGISWSAPGSKLVSLVTTSAGCNSFKTIDTVVVHAPPIAEIISSFPDNVCMGDTILMEARVGDSTDSYAWSPVPYFSAGRQAAAFGIMEHTGYIRVLVTSQWGCEAADSSMATTKPCCQVALPTAFSPNGDGRNDLFHILTIGHHQISNFRVVNRWGQTVFETRDETRGWDGTFNGQLQDIGTYYYYLRFRCNEGKPHDVEQKGEFVLVR
jgi:gliding motility-associated-like protein